MPRTVLPFDPYPDNKERLETLSEEDRRCALAHQPIYSLATLPGLRLKAVFCNGVVKTYDVRKHGSLLPDFFTNMSEEEFSQRTILDGSMRICWSDMEDMCCSGFWRDGEVAEETVLLPEHLPCLAVPDSQPYFVKRMPRWDELEDLEYRRKLPLIADFETLPGLRLKTTFKNGAVKIYDVKKLQAEEPFFARLSDAELERLARLSRDRDCILLTDEWDIHCEELWQDGETVRIGQKHPHRRGEDS